MSTAEPETTRTYVTEIWCPPADNGVHALSSRMPEPEPLPDPEEAAALQAEAEAEWAEPEWDSEDSNAYQDRIEAGLEPEWEL